MDASNQAFNGVNAALRDLGATRQKLAALIAQPKTTVDDLAAMRAEADVAVASIAAHEDALRSIERGLILANDEPGLAEREERLRDLAVNRERIAILCEELDKRRELVQRALDNEAARQWAGPKVKQLTEMLAELEQSKPLAEKLSELLKIADEARDLAFAIRAKADLYPEVSDLVIRWPDTRGPLEDIERLALRHTTLTRAPQPIPAVQYAVPLYNQPPGGN